MYKLDLLVWGHFYLQGSASVELNTIYCITVTTNFSFFVMNGDISSVDAPYRSSLSHTSWDTLVYWRTGFCCLHSPRTQTACTPQSGRGSTRAGRTRSRSPPTSAPDSDLELEPQEKMKNYQHWSPPYGGCRMYIIGCLIYIVFALAGNLQQVIFLLSVNLFVGSFNETTIHMNEFFT